MTELSDAYRGITIDSATTKDRDDAIWLERQADGSVLVRVFVAQVAADVPRGHRLDVGNEEHKGAYDRIESQYRADFTAHMLPRYLCERKLSLHPHMDRKALMVEFVLRPGADPEVRSVRSVAFRSLGAFAYSSIPSLLEEGGEEHKQAGMLRLAATTALQLLDMRRARGALALYDLDNGWTLNEDGQLVAMARDEANIGYIIVQEFMILANEIFARFCAETGIPVLYRNHRARSSAPAAEDLREQVQDAIHGGLGEIRRLQDRVRLVLGRADYGTSMEGHYGLGLPAYLHGTSPLRRYADLVNQRQIWAFVNDKVLPYTREELDQVAEHINTRIRERAEAKSAHFKSKDQARINAMVKNGITQLDAKEFDRAVKRSAGAAPGAVEAEYLRRLDEGGDLGPATHMRVIFQAASWEMARAAAIAHLQAAPHVGASVYAIGRNVLGLPPPKLTPSRAGPDHAPAFTCAAFCKHDGTKHRFRAEGHRTAKAAEQHALVGLIASLASLDLPPAAAPAAPEAEAAAPEPELTIPEPGDNPLATLHEFLQRVGGQVQYTSRREGPDHRPSFLVTCDALGLQMGGKAFSKKEAKRLSAQAWLEEAAANAAKGFRPDGSSR